MGVFGGKKPTEAPVIPPLADHPEWAAAAKLRDQIQAQLSAAEGELERARSRPRFDMEGDIRRALAGEQLPELGSVPPAPSVAALEARVKALGVARERHGEVMVALQNKLSRQVAADSNLIAHHQGLMQAVAAKLVELLQAVEQEYAFRDGIRTAGWNLLFRADADPGVLGRITDPHSVASQWLARLAAAGVAVDVRRAG
jgi:hypothetical protein